MLSLKNKIFWLITLLTMALVFLALTNAGNFNARLKNIFFHSIKVIDSNVFKKKSLSSAHEDMTFLIVGHSYGNYDRAEKSNNQTHPKIMRSIKSLDQKNLDATTIFLGDLAEQPNWKNVNRAFTEIDKISDKSIVVLGNHDSHPASYIKLFQRGFASYFAVDFGASLLLFLNTTTKMGDIDDAQLDFIKTQITSKDYTSIFFFSHHVIWNLDPNIDHLVNNDSATVKRSGDHLFSEFLKTDLLNDKPSQLIFFSGDMGNNAPYIDKTNDGRRYIAVGFGNNKLFPSSIGSYGYLVKLKITENGDYSISKVLID